MPSWIEPSQANLSSTFEHTTDEAFVIVKAAPRRSQQNGETVCCAALDREGKWIRLYPISFRHLPNDQKFRRWDRIQYRWRRPAANKDRRSESRRVDQDSIQILGALKPSDQHSLLNRAVVPSLKVELAEGRSLALIRPEIIEYWHKAKTAEEVGKEAQVLSNMRSQADMFALPTGLLPARPCPISFGYKYRDEDGVHTGTCQDWETEMTFLRRLREMGSEQDAIAWMYGVFGERYPKAGMTLAMGTHRYHPGQWLINGIVRLDEQPQLGLSF